MKNREVSRLFFWGFDGTLLTKHQRDLLKRFQPAGVILFKRNIESMKQIKSLTSDLRKATGRQLMIAIDEEGGRVSRLPHESIKFPPAQFWERVYDRTRDLRLIEKFGRILGRELREVGINTDFAPILDVNSNPQNPIIGDRAFSHDPRKAATLALAFGRGLSREKILICGKHFPGHGDTETDSHLTLPKVNRSRKKLQEVELHPFRQAVKARVPLLMTAHVVYEALDPRNPATLSKVILQDLLRKSMKYQGVVISDDLQMKAVAKTYTETESSLLALEAGCDLLLICEKLEEIGDSVMNQVAQEVSKSPVLQRRFQESLGRVEKILKRLG